MSLFSGLKKCDNEFCQRYVYNKDKGKYSYEKLALCSPECVHAAYLAAFMSKSQGKIDKTLLLEQIRDRLEKFKEEILAEYKGQMKELQIEKERLEFQIKTSTSILPIATAKEETKELVKSETVKTELTSLNIDQAESVISVAGESATEAPKPLTGSVEESSMNPFEEDLKDSGASSESLPEIKFQYIVPVRTTFRLKDPSIKLRETVEFAASVYDVSQGKVVASFQRFVKPRENPKLTEKELSRLQLRQEQIDSAKDLSTVLEEFDDFLASHKIKDKPFALMFVRHIPIGKKLLRETTNKGIKLKEYFMQYINLRNVFIQIYKNKKQLLNLQKIEKRLKHKSIEEVIYHLEDMVDLLNMKYKQRFINNLDIVENVVKICQKLTEKGFIFTNKLLYKTAFYDKKEGGDKTKGTEVGHDEFEII